jgi:hypothetical protein
MQIGKIHPLTALFWVIIITLAGISREIGIDASLNSFWKGILYFCIILSITVLTIVFLTKK